MKIRSSLLVIVVAVTFYQVCGQTVSPRTDKSKEEKKQTDAKEKAAKADVLIQKNNIYDKQINDSKQNNVEIKTTHSVKEIHVKSNFHKRKLNHRLRKRRY